MNFSNLRLWKLWRNKALILEEMSKGTRNYNTFSKMGLDLEKLRPIIIKRIEERERAKDRTVNPTLSVAREVLRARNALYDGVSTLIHHLPVWACKYCPEVYIGESGHLIRTCHGYRQHSKNKVHGWVRAGINDIVVPVESYHLQKKSQNVIKHHERFDHHRIPAVVELCLQAGVDVNDQMVSSSMIPPANDDAFHNSTSQVLSYNELRLIARQTMNAWETLRFGVRKLLFVYPSRICQHCKEVHVGPSGYKARSCGVLKNEIWSETHTWKKARVDDLVPPNMVWHRRRQDSCVLVDHGRAFYGHAPAVVDLCSKAGALVPPKYFCMMKLEGLTAPARVST